MTVRQLLSNIDSRELSEWIAYYKLRETPEERKPRGLDDQIKTALKSRKRKKG